MLRTRLLFYMVCSSFGHKTREIRNDVTVLTALGLSNFAKTGPLPTDHIPDQRSFRTSQIAPFATNVQFQCEPTVHYYSVWTLIPAQYFRAAPSLAPRSV